MKTLKVAAMLSLFFAFGPAHAAVGKTATGNNTTTSCPFQNSAKLKECSQTNCLPSWMSHQKASAPAARPGSGSGTAERST